MFLKHGRGDIVSLSLCFTSKYHLFFVFIFCICLKGGFHHRFEIFLAISSHGRRGLNVEGWLPTMATSRLSTFLCFYSQFHNIYICKVQKNNSQHANTPDGYCFVKRKNV